MSISYYYIDMVFSIDSMIDHSLSTERLKKQIDEDFEIPQVSIVSIEDTYCVFINGSDVSSYRIAQSIYEQFYEQQIKGVIFVDLKEYNFE